MLERHPCSKDSQAPGPPHSLRCRVWVVDAEGRAVGVVTPTDTLRLVIA